MSKNRISDFEKNVENASDIEQLTCTDFISAVLKYHPETEPAQIADAIMNNSKWTKDEVTNLEKCAIFLTKRILFVRYGRI